LICTQTFSVIYLFRYDPAKTPLRHSCLCWAATRLKRSRTKLVSINRELHFAVSARKWLNGATALTVPTLHVLDALTLILGDLASVEATLAVRRSEARLVEARLVEDPTTIPITAPDQIAILGTLRSGAVVSIFYRGDASRGENLR
jgi:hypothetical protein